MSDWSAVYPSRHGPVICPKLDWYIGRSLQLYGEYSQGEVDLLAPLLAPGNIIIDVGANVGALTLPLSKLVGPTGRVKAFEPQRGLYHCLCGTLALNSVDNVRVELAAVGQRCIDIDVPIPDYREPANFGGMRLDPFRPVRDRPHDTLPLVTLDRYCGAGRIDLIKIDCEGMEYAVLLGAGQTIRRDRPVLFVEAGPEPEAGAVYDLLVHFGYQVDAHEIPLYNPVNWLGNPDNIFPDICSRMFLATPQ
jgi:FkbM family methyltransferase